MFKVGDVVCCIDAMSRDGFLTCTLKHQGIYKIVGLGVLSRVGEPCALVSGHDVWSPLWRFKHLPKADDTFINQMRSLKPAKEKTRV